jgi:aminoglycoside 6'-N-acetyltransferase
MCVMEPLLKQLAPRRNPFRLSFHTVCKNYETAGAINNDMNGSNIFTFSPLRAADLPILFEWLNRPHMRAYYQKTPTSLSEVTAKFLPRIQGEFPTYDHVVSYGINPLGKLQCYKNTDHPDYAREVGLHEGISVDLFIGEATMLGRGLGRRMLRQYVTEVAFPLYPDESKCFICHELTNLPVRACSRAAGFQAVREVMEGGVPSELLIFRRPEASGA